ncbi:hypothetical protein FRC12_025058 [Ceratobasidium sp. 428]|nr:hypothetical protein FRC12_025058 [Ceratobasidium sp. 428]
MSESNFTIEDISPLISYQGQWSEILSPALDSSLSSYQNSSFHSTQDGTAQAIWTFRGSALYIYGARRAGHGHYSVKLDDAAPEEFDGRPQSGNDEFQYPLYVKTGLSNTVHTVTLSNVPYENRTGLDIDYVTWTIEKNSTYQERYIDDTEFEYADPYPVWFNRTHSDGYYQLTYHSTFKGTSASFKFNGSDVYIYGGTGRTEGTNQKYQGITRVYIDGHDYVSRFNKTTDSSVRVQCIFYMGDLGNGTHTVVISNDDNAGLNLDYAVVVGYGDDVQVAPQSSGSGKPVVAGAIAGTVVGGAVLLAAFVIIAVWLLRRRHRRMVGRNTFTPDLIYSSHGGSLPNVEPYQSSTAIDSMVQTVPTNPPLRKGMRPEVSSMRTHSENRTSMLAHEYSDVQSSDGSELPPSYEERLRDRLTAARGPAS